MTELLIAKTGKASLNVKVVERKKSRKDHRNYEQTIYNKDFNTLAYLLFDLEAMGYPIEKAIAKYREMRSDPGLFFLK